MWWIGLIVSVASSLIQYSVAQEQADAQQAVANEQAKSAELQGEAQAIEKRKELLKNIASINASAAASGLALTGSGSVQNAREQSKREANRQLDIIRSNARGVANDYRQQGITAQQQARAKGVSLLASTASSAAGSYYGSTGGSTGGGSNTLTLDTGYHGYGTKGYGG